MYELSESVVEARQEEVAFKRLADLGPVIVWMTDNVGRVTYLNSRWLEFTGRGIDDVDWSSVIHPEDYEQASLRFRGGIQDFAPFRFEARFRRRDGAWRWHEVTGAPTSDGLPGNGFVGHAIDIHDRKSVSDRLRDQRDLIWNLIGDLMAVLDADGSILIANPAWEEVLGISEAEVRGRPLREFVDREALPFFDDMLEGIVKSGRDGVMELDMRCGDIERKVIWTGKPRGGSVYLIGRDVTEERKAEAALAEAQDELRQAQKMEAIGQLTGGIAHDFNNLLTGIVGGLSMAQLKIRTGKVSEAERFINLASASAKKAGGLTHRLLTFSRRQSLEVRTVDANAVIASMTDLVSRTVGDAVIVKTDLWDEGLAVRIDVNQLENALLNLAINARDAMDGNGEITIASKVCEYRREGVDGKLAVPEGNYAVISVADTGGGMDAATLEHAAEPFFTTKPQGEGTGLGLSMVYGFVEQSGGAVRIDSRLGEGTTVRLWLPLSSDPVLEAPADGDGEDGDETRPAAVMIVEDHEMVRTLARDILSDAGYLVSVFEDGESALDAISSGYVPDVLVTDVGLPGMDGRDLASEVIRRVAGVAVVFVTGHGEGEIVDAGGWGRFDTVIKPFAVKELTAKVGEATRRAAASGRAVA